MAGDSSIEEQLIVVSPQAHAKASAIADTADEQGAHVIHRFGPRVMITELPKHKTERVRSALPNAEVAAHPNELSPQATEDLDAVGVLGLAAFQLRQSPEYISAKESRSYDNVAWDCGGTQRPPDPPPELQDLAKVGAAAPTYEKAEGKTSQRMTGKIAVGIIIVSGPVPNLQFSDEETKKVMAEVQECLGWWASQNPAANITWIYDIHSVKVNVDSRSRDPDKESYWRDAAMDKLGYTKRSPRWQDMYDYVNNLRSKNNADWGYIAFVVKYPIGNAVAYAAFGGPRLVLQYNHSALTPDNIDHVFAHETGHIFQAPDEYGDYCDCGGALGIYNRPNANCDHCAAGGGVDCLMRKGSWSICKWTAWHVGFPWPPGFTINNSDSTPVAPAACAFKNSLYVFWKGPNDVNRIYYSSSSDGMKWSDGKTINGIDATPTTPAVCVFNDKLYVFWQANDPSNRIFFSWSTDGVTWTNGQTINNVDATSVTPSACVFNNRLYLFWKEANESARISFSSSKDGVNWPKAELTKYLETTLSAPSACVFNNTLFVFWKDLMSGRIRFISQAGTSWTSATNINGIDSTPEPPVPCVWNNKLYLFWTREDTSIYVSSSSDGSSWPAGKQINLVDSTRAALAAAVFQNYAYLFWKANNPSNSIYYTA